MASPLSTSFCSSLAKCCLPASGTHPRAMQIAVWSQAVALVPGDLWGLGSFNVKYTLCFLGETSVSGILSLGLRCCRSLLQC